MNKTKQLEKCENYCIRPQIQCSGKADERIGIIIKLIEIMLVSIGNACMKFLHVAKFRQIHKAIPPFVHQRVRGEQKQVQSSGCIPPE